MNFFKRKLALITVIVLSIVAFLALFYFDKALLIGLFLIISLTAITFLILYKLKVGNKTLYLLFLITLFIHLGVALFFHYTQFQPLGGGGGDFIIYQQIAEEVAQRINQGVYSLEGLNSPHYYPVLIGIIYALTLPEIIIGELFSVWLVAIAVLFVYLIVVEIGGSKKWAFLIGLIVSIYPSYLYFGSVLLKDTVIIPLVLSGMLLSIRMMKVFSWQKFFIFYIILTALIHFRFYVGYAVLFSFIICWFLISSFKIKKRIVFGVVIVYLLGFSPQLLGYGYYGTKPLKYYLTPEVITVYREVVYAPPPAPTTTAPTAAAPVAEAPTTGAPTTGAPTTEAPTTPPPPPPGLGSSFVVETGFDSPFKFIKNSLESFICSLLGPFPWQIKYKRQFFSLLEVIPWYLFFYIIIQGIYKFVITNGWKRTLQHYKFTLPLLMFSIMALGALSLFINNFGIITRIRIPSFIALLCLIIFNEDIDKKLNKLSKYYYEKKFIKFPNLSDL